MPSQRSQRLLFFKRSVLRACILFYSGGNAASASTNIQQDMFFCFSLLTILPLLK